MATFKCIIVSPKAQGANQLAKIIENGTETDFTLGVEVDLTQAQVDLLNAAGYNPIFTASSVAKYPQPVAQTALDPVPTVASNVTADTSATLVLTHDIKVAASPGGAGKILLINRLRGTTWSSVFVAVPLTPTTSPMNVTMASNAATGDIHWVECSNGGGARFTGPKFTTP